MKFGVHLLLYPPEGPSKSHSLYGVRVYSSNDKYQQFMDSTRILDNISKTLVCIIVDITDKYHPVKNPNMYKEREVVINRWIPSKPK